jgi:hypothetical protein
MICTAAQPRSILVRRAEREEGRLVEFESELTLDTRRSTFRESSLHPNRLERFLLEVMSLLRVERQNFKGDIGIRHE